MPLKSYKVAALEAWASGNVTPLLHADNRTDPQLVNALRDCAQLPASSGLCANVCDCDLQNMSPTDKAIGLLISRKRHFPVAVAFSPRVRTM